MSLPCRTSASNNIVLSYEPASLTMHLPPSPAPELQRVGSLLLIGVLVFQNTVCFKGRPEYFEVIDVIRP